MSGQRAGSVHIEPWAEGDLALLERTLGDPAMMELDLVAGRG